nr:unnamed protein product [Spirometra erinaceieuropaei]
MTGRGIVEADSLETLNYNTQNGASSRNIPRLPLLSGSSSIGSESLDYRGYLDIEFDSSASFNNEAFGSTQQPPIHLLHPQDDASTRTIRPLSLQLNKENPNEISSWICEAREEESEGLAHGGWPTNMADLTPKQSTYCCYEGGRPEVETREPSKDRTFCPPLHEDESACFKEVERIPVPKGPPGQSYLLTEMDKRFRKEGTKKKNFNSPLPIQNVKTRHEQEKNFVQANKKNTGRSRVPEETSYCKVLSQKQAKDRSSAFPQKKHQCLPENVVRPGRQVHVEIQEEVPSTTSALQRKWLAQASAADLSSMILEQKKQLEHAFDKLMKRMDEQKKTASERAEQRTICFIVLVADDGPKLYIVSKHNNVAVKTMDAVINIDEEEDRAKNGALRYPARNLHLCRLLATKTDSLRPTDQKVFNSLQKLASYPYAAELV